MVLRMGRPPGPKKVPVTTYLTAAARDELLDEAEEANLSLASYVALIIANRNNE